MPSPANIADVANHGAVILGKAVVCDGFYASASIRVQSHIHSDHMNGFNSSKLFQTIVCSEPTKALLIAELNADLPYRPTIKTVGDSGFDFDGGRINLVSSGHILGAVQTRVEYDSGLCIGYSGDFNWPLENVIQVEELVVDSTYGSPNGAKKFPQEQVKSRFLEIVGSSLATGSVHIKGGRGTIHRAAELLFDQFKVPMVGSAAVCRDVKVYRNYGYAIDDIANVDSPEFEPIEAGAPHIRLYSLGDSDPVGIIGQTVLYLSAYWSQETDPLLTIAADRYRLAMSDHADFEGTLAYVVATGAKRVVTDNTRGGHAITLAGEINRRLNIEARPSTTSPRHIWGT